MAQGEGICKRTARSAESEAREPEPRRAHQGVCRGDGGGKDRTSRGAPAVGPGRAARRAAGTGAALLCPRAAADSAAPASPRFPPDAAS